MNLSSTVASADCNPRIQTERRPSEAHAVDIGAEFIDCLPLSFYSMAGIFLGYLNRAKNEVSYLMVAPKPLITEL